MIMTVMMMVAPQRKEGSTLPLTFSGCDSHRLQHCRPLLGLCQMYPHCTVWSNKCLYNNSVFLPKPNVQRASAEPFLVLCQMCFCSRPGLLVLRHMQILLLQASWTVSFYTVEFTGPPSHSSAYQCALLSSQHSDYTTFNN